MLRALGRAQRLQNAFYRRLEYCVALVTMGIAVLGAQRWLGADQLNVMPIAGIFLLAAGAVALSSWKVSVEYLVARREARRIVREYGYPIGIGTRPGL